MTDELQPFATIEDVEVFLKHSIPAALVEYAERKLSFASNVLRMMARSEGNNWEDTSDDALLTRMLKDTVAANVAIDVKKEEAKSDEDTDLSMFKQFTQTAGSYSFSGTWQGSNEDVFFTENQLTNLGIGLSTISAFSIFSDGTRP